MVADTMILEVFEQMHTYTGLITVVRFFLAFTFSKVLEP